MSKRVFQIAKELGMASKSLIERIKDLGIDDSVTNALSSLSEENVRKLKAALANEAPPSEEKPLAAGVVRRRAPRRRTVTETKPDEQDEALADDLDDEDTSAEQPSVVTETVREEDEVAPVRRRRIATVEHDDVVPSSARAAATKTVEKQSEPVAVETTTVETTETEPEDEVAPVRRRRFATVTTRTDLEPKKEDAPAAVVETRTTEVAAASDDASDDDESASDDTQTTTKKKRRRFATVVTRRTVEADDEGSDDDAVEDESEVKEEEPAPRARFATVHTHDDDDETKRSPVELAEIARREADAASRSRGGAEILGTIDIDVINQRNEQRRGGRDGGRGAGPMRDRGGLGAPGAPGPEGRPARRRGKQGKRVVQSGELYGKFNRHKSKKKRRGSGQPVQQTTAAEHKRVVRMEEAIVVSELAHQMGVKAGEIVMKLAFDLGLRGTNINTPIDYPTASLIAEQYNHKVEQVGFDMSDYLPKYDNSEASLEPRPPVVTVMGHVDHGKTSLLDAIRTTGVSVAQGEAGGITQHIGAYKVAIPQGEICFLDTPGHEAFSALRARGAKATDIVILVVAGDDGVMPQTVEALKHARAAKTPIIVAITKIDKPEANPQRIKAAFTEHNLIDEELGGDTRFVEVSSKTGDGIDELLEAVLLQAEVMELKANPNRQADGIAIESRLDVGRGPIATVLVQGGTLRVGDIIVIGKEHGRVRSMTDEAAKSLTVATPSTPVEITGLSGVPASGEHFYVVNEEKDARAIADHISQQNKQAELAVSASSAVRASSEGDIGEFLPQEDFKELKIIIKGDVQGSVEALEQSIKGLANEQVSVRIIHSGVGSITESDVNLANSSLSDSEVVICGFNVRPEQRAAALADQTGVQLLTHTIIYDLLDDVRAMMAGLLDPVYEEEVVGHAEVRMVFQNSRVGAVAGCLITDGFIRRGAHARVLRDSIVVHTSTIGSLRHIDRDERELKAGMECGLSVDGFATFKPGDIVECFLVHERPAELL